MLYFIRSGQYVKIGVADNPWERLSNFQIASPEKIELLAVAPGSFDEEARHHSMFSKHHARGEWYHASEPILDFIYATREKYHEIQERPVISLYANDRAKAAKKKRRFSISAVDAVRLVVNTAVAMVDNEPAIDVRSVTESRRGPGILIWIPGYVSNGDTIIVASAGMSEEAAPTAPQEEATP